MGPPLTGVDDTLDRARRRLRLRRVVWWSALVGHVGLWVGAGAGVVAHLVGLGVLVASGIALAVVASFTGAGAVVGLLWPVLGRRELAFLVDRTLGTEELLVTAVHVADTDDPRRDDILSRVARQTHSAADLAAALPVRRPRHLSAAPLPLLALIVGLWLAPTSLRPLLGLPDPDGAEEPLVEEARRLVDRLDEIDETTEVTLPDELEREIAELADDLSGESLSPEEALERLEGLQSQLEAFQERLEPSQDLLDDLEEAAKQLDAQATQDLADALQNGNMDAAADAARDLSDALSEASPAEQQQAADALQQAGEKLQQSDDPSLQQTGRSMSQAGEQLGEQAAAQQQAGEQGQQGSDGQQGQGAEGSPSPSGMSPEQAEQLARDLQQARDVGEQLQRDQQALDRAQQMNAAMEGSRQRLGGEASVERGDGSQDGEGGEGEQGQGQGGPGGEDGEDGAQGSVAQQGQGTTPGVGAGDGHTWEDEGELPAGAGQTGSGEEDRTDDRTSAEHIDDFEKLYEAVRLEGADALMASVDDEIDATGRVDELTTRLTGAEEDASTAPLVMPAQYRQEASEAIEAEQIPPGYREAVKQYFDGQ